jgi:hypothetical protein
MTPKSQSAFELSDTARRDVTVHLHLIADEDDAAAGGVATIEMDHKQAEIQNKDASDFLAAADKARATSEVVKSAATHAGPDVDRELSRGKEFRRRTGSTASPSRHRRHHKRIWRLTRSGGAATRPLARRHETAARMLEPGDARHRAAARHLARQRARALWLNLQQAYDLWHARARLGAALGKIKPMLSDMA